MIIYQKYNASGALGKYIRYFYFIEHKGSAKNASVQRVTPDGCIEVNFNLAGKSLQRISGDGKQKIQAENYVVNRTAGHYFVQRKGNVKMIGVCFYPWNFNAFTKIPLYAFKNEQIDASEIFGTDIKWLYEQLSEAENNHIMVSLIEEYLMKRLVENRIDTLVELCAMKIDNNPFVSVSSIASDSSVSDRRLEQRFKNAMGVSPKQFLRLNRFQKSLAQLKKGNSLDLVFKHGYYDQAHFIKEFKSFSGISPEKYLSENHGLNDLVTNWGRA